jgi:hypothetical protein
MLTPIANRHGHTLPPMGAIVTIRYRDLQPGCRWRRFRVVAFDLKAPHTCYVEALDNRHVVYQVSGS